MMSKLPVNAVGVMELGLVWLKLIQEIVQEDKYFVLRIKNNWNLEFQSESRLTKIGSSTNAQAYRMVNFCDVETKTEFRLVTNLPDDGDAAVSDDEIRDIYRLRWGVELFWKFLKMHLKLDKLISKSVNGITRQVYASLIAYLILELISIPAQGGNKLLDKIRYLQACMCQKISFVHWFEELMFGWNFYLFSLTISRYIKFCIRIQHFCLWFIPTAVKAVNILSYVWCV